MAAADARLLKLISGGGRRAAFVGLLRDLAKGGAASASKTAAAPLKVKPPKAGKGRKAGKKAKKKAA